MPSIVIGDRQWLEKISRNLLYPSKRIELPRREKLLRIVASKTTAEVILQEINQFLSIAETRTFNISSAHLKSYTWSPRMCGRLAVSLTL
jgi:hypothetical protein